MLSKKDFENYRFYQCVMKPHGYECYKIKDLDYKILNNSILVPIDKIIPEINILERNIIKYKLTPSYINIKTNF